MKFTVGFEKEDRNLLHKYWDQIIDSEQWSWPGSYYERTFEEKFAEYIGTKNAISFSSWWGAALATLSYFRQWEYSSSNNILCPSNTFMATPMAIKQSGFDVKFVDSNREDLCMSYDHAKYCEGIGTFLVHIGGHIAFDIEKFIERSKKKFHFLIEDCAHAVGAEYKGKKAGTFGQAGIFSFHATKTISTGEGGMITTDSDSLDKWARKFRDYGKEDYKIPGGNFRMSEFTAAIGCVQVPRIDEIVDWKREYVEKNYSQYPTVNFPEGMISNYYKFISFEDIGQSTGKVYDKGCAEIMGDGIYLPNTQWINNHHWCLPTWYRGDEK